LVLVRGSFSSLAARRCLAPARGAAPVDDLGPPEPPPGIIGSCICKDRRCGPALHLQNLRAPHAEVPHGNPREGLRVQQPPLPWLPRRAGKLPGTPGRLLGTPGKLPGGARQLPGTAGQRPRTAGKLPGPPGKLPAGALSYLPSRCAPS
jgi:hypothetical protein